MEAEFLKELEEKAIRQIRDIFNEARRNIASYTYNMDRQSICLNKAPLETSQQQNDSETTIENVFGFNPTEEQTSAIELASKGEDIKIEAYSGSGKTTLLEAISRVSLSGKTSLYLAFNKAIANEAKSRFPHHTSCLTTHSLAFRALVNNGQLDPTRITSGIYPNQLVNLLDIEEGIGSLTNLGLAAYALDIIKNYVQSNDKLISKRHKRSKIILGIPKDVRKEVYDHGLSIAKEIWSRVTANDSDFPILHDYYLKMWTLTSPVLNYDSILIDEAQDSNKAVLGVLKKQKSQLIWVGDKYQSIYSWRGAFNALNDVLTKNVASISKSFRFGSVIAELASDILSKGYDRQIKITGNENVQSTICLLEKPSAFISRTNASVISSLMRYNRTNPTLKLYVEGGVYPLKQLVQGICNLQDGKRTLYPELASFENWDEAVQFSKTPDGIGLIGIVKLGNEYNLSSSLKLLNSKVISDSQYGADTIFTTVHKAKGKEYNTVSLTDDFSDINIKTQKEEINLLYVAVTRAINKLDISQCIAIQKLA